MIERRATLRFSSSKAIVCIEIVDLVELTALNLSQSCLEDPVRTTHELRGRFQSEVEKHSLCNNQNRRLLVMVDDPTVLLGVWEVSEQLD